MVLHTLLGRSGTAEFNFFLSCTAAAVCCRLLLGLENSAVIVTASATREGGCCIATAGAEWELGSLAQYMLLTTNPALNSVSNMQYIRLRAAARRVQRQV
jgi:hypothetical protein